MQPSGCPGRDELTAFAAGESPPPQREAVAAHAASCPACREALERLRAESGTAAFDLLPPFVPADDPHLPETAYHRAQQRWAAALGLETPTDAPAGGRAEPALPDVPGYEILGVLGRGGMGMVLRARDAEFHRSLAIKVLLPGREERPDLVRRFLEEAQLMGQLQHPGVPPVHRLGRLADGRPFFAMKLIQGDTLSRLLKGRADGGANEAAGGAAQTPPDRAHLLGVFEQICQTLAYAHSCGIIHRDLKPANVMVGAFGEVQVMDWGLAKLLGGRPAFGESAAEETSVIEPVRGELSGADTRVGQILGTPAYMAPEMARGRVDEVDERADVFGLGAILCTILTGLPPFSVSGNEDLLALVRRGALEGAWRRLEACGADADLVALARRCLAADREDRPRHAGEVAGAVTAYLQSVRERLRQAEVAAAAARARAEGERRRRRLAVALAGVVLLLVVGAAGGALWYQQDRAALAAKRQLDRLQQEQEQRGRLARNEQAVRQALGTARRLREEVSARLRQPLGVFRLLNQPAQWEQPLAAARTALQHAQDLAAGSERPLDAELVRAMADLEAALRQDTADRELAQRLDKVREDSAAAIGDPQRDARTLRAYPRVFREARLRLQPGREREVVDRIRRSAVREQLLASLDDWALVARKVEGQARVLWLRVLPTLPWSFPRLQAVGREHVFLLRVARLADPDPWRDRVRDPLTWVNRTAVKRLTEQLLNDRAAKARLSPQLLDLWGQVLLGTKQPNCTDWLRHAQALHPMDFWLLFDLGEAMLRDGPPHVEAGESVVVSNLPGPPPAGAPQAEGVYRAALAVRPGSRAARLALGLALAEQKKYAEAESCFSRMLEAAPADVIARMNLGLMRLQQKDYPGAEAHFRKALADDPKSALAWSNLAMALVHQRDLSGAEKALRHALALDGAMAPAWVNLARILATQGRLPQAEEACRQAVRLEPGTAVYRNALGNVLMRRNDYLGAEECFREAVKRIDRYPDAWFNLGMARLNRRDYAGAEQAFRNALRTDPNHRDAAFYLAVARNALKNLK